MPITFFTYLIGGLALAGVPPLSGFFSKDEIILVAYKSHTWWLAITLLLGAVITAFYTMRMLRLTFYGEYRGTAHPHESPASITGPLVVLAGATIFTGWLGFSGTGAPFLDWVYFGAPEAPEFSPIVAGLSMLMVGIGLFAAYRLYRTYRERDPLRSLGSLYGLLEHKYYLDDFYLNGIVYPIRDKASAAVYWFNQSVLDAVVNAAGAATRGLAQLVSLFDQDVIDGAVNGVAGTAGFSGGILRYIQSGSVQRYMAFLFVGVLVLAIVFTRVV
jgi:NADH-quinone oxidoreductase subunit L